MKWGQFRKQPILGMDLGVSGVKIVRQEGGPDTSRTLSCWFYPGPVLEHEEQERTPFLDFLTANHLTEARVVCNIEDLSLKIRRIDLPKMPDADLREAIRWQLRAVVEGDVAAYVVRYSVLEEYSAGETKKLALLVYAIKKDAIQRRLDFLRRLSLNPAAVEPTSVSLLAAFDSIKGWEPGEYYGLIDFGESKSVFTAMGEGKLFFSRPLAGVSGREVSALLSRELALPAEETERLKRHLLNGTPLEGKNEALRERAEGLLASLLTQICVETQRSLDAFFLMFRKEKIHHLVLCGGCATIPGLLTAMSRNLALPTSLLDPSQKFPQKFPMESGSSHLFDTALGLALFPL